MRYASKITTPAPTTSDPRIFPGQTWEMPPEDTGEHYILGLIIVDDKGNGWYRCRRLMAPTTRLPNPTWDVEGVMYFRADEILQGTLVHYEHLTGTPLVTPETTPYMGA